jgi:hypothetical protein
LHQVVGKGIVIIENENDQSSDSRNIKRRSGTVSNDCLNRFQSNDSIIFKAIGDNRNRF